ncbi:dTDP-4-dehydrorhamnose reductase [Planotetraspora phitsanulokensis]|uniref:dTDP-4-dehydrorhamnose reductase n=1 Tax=Planotetraspora phitsanulokensis TaxID=575192 RepID=A0A8J3U3S6_9ACTN|nr:dTDP-4-dehydrorhamnose reductase [Planotetraspora phitsanulokensis]GII37884.1 NAD(P)-dependent oxidoreductase [Planotetraspora phitsanulokensis]
MVTGARGMLGADLLETLAGDEVTGFGRELDVRDDAAVADAVRELKPDVVVNCAAWTAVDDAETHEEEAMAVNGHAVRGLARACADGGARLIQVSTDYVFDGTRREPYGENDPVSPVNAYGRTKLAGEVAALEHGHVVVRTAWLYGAHGPNFVKTMMRLAAERETVSVVTDQEGQPTSTRDLAAQLVALGRSPIPGGVYHGTCSGRTSWHGFAREIFTLLGADPERVLPTTADAYARPAPRPAYSVLAHGRWSEAGLAPMRDWKEALRDAWPYLSFS